MRFFIDDRFHLRIGGYFHKVDNFSRKVEGFDLLLWKTSSFFRLLNHFLPNLISNFRKNKDPPSKGDPHHLEI